jgi:Domain of unknown function (DUF932)
MKSGRTLNELAAELTRQQESKRDFVADTRMMNMTPDAQEIELLDENEEPLFAGEATRHCHQQVAQRLQIPMKYYDRMKEEAPQLLARNVNHWFEKKPERRMLRTLDGEARAFMSSRYRPLDNFDLAEAVLPQIQKLDMSVESCEVTERHMYIKVIAQRIIADITVGDPVQAGLVVSNSEIGCGSLRVEPLVYRLVCKNGMISADHSMKKYHVGRGDGQGEGAYEFFRDETRRQDDRAFWMKVSDTVRGALNESQFMMTVKKLQAIKENKIEDVQKTVEVVATNHMMNENEQNSILKHLIEGGDLSQYGLMNAITRTSQDIEDYDRATDFERIGGQIIEMPKTDWSKLVA